MSAEAASVNMEKKTFQNLAYTADFVLKTWGIITANGADSADRLKSRLKVQDPVQYTKIMQFLQGESITLGSSEMLSVLERECQTAFGEAPICMMLLAFCTSSNCIMDVFECYEGLLHLSTSTVTTKTSVSLYLKSLAEVALNIALYRIHQEIANCESASENIFESVPNAVIDAMGKSNLIMLLRENGPDFFAEANKACLKVIADCNALYSDVELFKKRQQMWQRLTISVVHYYIHLEYSSWKDKPIINMFEILLLDTLSFRIGTKACINVRTPKGETKQVHVHPEVLQRFTECEWINTPMKEDRLIIAATAQDVQTFTSLLYLDGRREKSLRRSQGNLTIGVYNLAKALGIQNLHWFLFRDETCTTLFSETKNKVDFVQVLVKLRIHDMLQEFLQLFHLQYTNEEQMRVFMDLSADDVLYFCSFTDSLQHLCELQKYLMLENWAKAEAANKEPNNDDDDEDNSLIKTKFALVQKGLCLGRLARAAYGSFSKIKYVDQQELIQSGRELRAVPSIATAMILKIQI